MRRRPATLLLLASLSGSFPAHADVLSDCNSARSADRQIRGCTILIENGRLTGANLAVAHTNRGNAYGMQKRYAEALKDYATALTLDPHAPLAHYNKANVLFDLGRLKEAEADYTRAIEEDGTFALAFFNRGLVRERLGDRTGARGDYKTVVALDGGFAAKASARLKRLGTQPAEE